jgi:hypothetical protein
MIKIDKLIPAAVVIGIIAFVILISYLIKKDESTYKYRITDMKHCYRTDEYTEYDDGCVSFIAKKWGDHEVTICGPYTIIVNPNYVPQ